MQKNIIFKSSEIIYEVSGNGNVIVLIHGFVESLDIWKELIPVLNKKYKTISLDLPGHGTSGLFSPEISIDDMAQVIHEVLIAENVSDVLMIGHSMGGYVAMAYADLYPENLKGVGLFHSSALADSDDKKADRLRAVEAVKNNHKDFAVTLVSKLFKEENEKNFPSEASKLKEIARSISPEALIASLMAMRNRPDRTPTLSKLNIPFLFIWGKNDKVLDFNNAFPQAKIPQTSQVLILNEAGHLGFIEAKTETFFTLEKFAEFCDLKKFK